MQFRKVVQYVRLRFVPFLVAGVILVSPLSLCANAAVWEGNANIGFTYWNANGVPFYNGVDVTLPISGVQREEARAGLITNGMRLSLGELEFTSPVSIYINGYYRNSHSGASIFVIGDPWAPANYEVKYTYDNSDIVNQPISGISEFTPIDEASMAYVGKGIGLYAKVDASDAHPVKDILVRPINECGWKRGGANSLKGFWYWTSVRVISAETSAELDELNNIAQQIVAGNETLEAMLGDVVSLLQQIYAITGDINIAADRTVDLLNTMLDYVDGIEGQLTDIYGLLSGFFTSITKLLKDQHSELMGSLVDFHMMVEGRLHDIYMELSGEGGPGDILEGAQDQVEQGSAVQEGLGELEKPDYEDFDFNTGDYVDQFDGGSGESSLAMSHFMGALFGNSLITSMLMITLSFAMVAYVLYGKR